MKRALLFPYGKLQINTLQSTAHYLVFDSTIAFIQIEAAPRLHRVLLSCMFMALVSVEGGGGTNTHVAPLLLPPMYCTNKSLAYLQNGYHRIITGGGGTSMIAQLPYSITTLIEKENKRTPGVDHVIGCDLTR